MSKSNTLAIISHQWVYQCTLSAIKYSFDLQMFLRNAREEHIEAYKDAVKAARDFLDGVAILAQGRLPRSLFSDNQIINGFINIY